MADTPQVKVEIAFGVNATLGSGFVLDDPSRGLLDSSTLAPDDAWVDVSDTVISRGGPVSTKRGRERYTDEPEGGTARFTLENSDRRYDPTAETLAGSGAAAPYYGQLMPMRRVRISAVWADGSETPVWAGYVDQWPTDYHQAHSEVTIQCVDGFAVLAAADLAETALKDAGDEPWERIARALDEASFPATRNLDDGVESLAATTYGENALQFVKRVALSDVGRLFVSADGTLTFRDRNNIQRDSSVTLGTDLPVRHVEVDTSADQLWNRVVVRLEDGTEATVDDQASQADFLLRQRTFSDLMLASATRAEAYGEMMLSRYAEPRSRVSSVTVRLAALSEAQQQTVLGLDVGDLVQVRFAPTSGGSPAEVIEDGVVEGVQVTVDRGRDWTVRLALSSTEVTSPLVLDDATFGRLDENVVMF